MVPSCKLPLIDYPQQWFHYFFLLQLSKLLKEHDGDLALESIFAELKEAAYRKLHNIYLANVV